MVAKINAHEENKTWNLTDLLLGKKAISCKWVYKCKFNSDGTLECYKTRFVAKGVHTTKRY